MHLRSGNVKYSLSWSSNNKSCKIKVVDRKRLRRSTKVCKCICAQLLKCANGCTVYYLFCPSHTKSGGQGLPRTIAIAIAQKDIYQRIFISYILSKNREKGYSPITFLSEICWGILCPNFRDFNVLYHILSYNLFRKKLQFWGTFALQNAFALSTIFLSQPYQLWGTRSPKDYSYSYTLAIVA
jgi:hypothetical protein